MQSFFNLPINPVELTASLQDRVMGEQSAETFQIPASAFRHTDPSEQINKEAKLPDGSQLPSFVQFNAQTGEFTVNSQQARLLGVEAVDVKVVGRDTQGNEASADFRIIITNTEGSSGGQPNPQAQGQPGQGEQGQAGEGEGQQPNQQAAPTDQDASIDQPVGKLALAEQLRQTGPGLFQAQRDALLSILRDQAA